MIKLTLQQLRLFAAVAKHETMTQAAENLYISQSAVSMSLSEMESQLGKPLFDRIGKRLMLNHHGKKLLPKVEIILEQVRTLPNTLDETEEELSGELYIGASTTIGNYLLPVLLTRFIEKHPQVNVKLSVKNTEDILADMANLKLDIAYIEGSCHHPDLLTQTWQQDELIVIAHPSHPLCKIDKLTWQDFATAKWILRENGSGTRELFNQAIGKRFKPEVLLDLAHSEAIKQAVMQNAGLSCLSKLAVQNELKSGRFVALSFPGLHLNRQLLEVTHSKRSLSPIVLSWQNSAKYNI